MFSSSSLLLKPVGIHINLGFGFTYKPEIATPRMFGIDVLGRDGLGCPSLACAIMIRDRDMIRDLGS